MKKGVLAIILALLAVLTGAGAFWAGIPDTAWFIWLSGVVILFVVWICYGRFLKITFRDFNQTDNGIFEFAGMSLLFVLVQIFTFALIYKTTELVGATRPAHYVYFSVVTWTTVGYGDILPTDQSKFVASVEALTGYLFMGIFIGVLSSLLFKSLTEKNSDT